MLIQFSTGLIFITVKTSFQKFEKIKTKHFKLHFIRSFSGILAFTAFVICIRKTNIVDATLLLNSTPIFIPIIAYIWLRKKIESRIWPGIITGFIGIVLIIHPVTGELLQMGELYGVASGILLAIGYIAMKELTRTETFESILFYYSLISVILSLPFALMNEVKPSSTELIYGMSSGVCFMLYLYLLQYAYKLEEAVKLAPLNFSTVAFTVIFNFILFNNTPDLITVAGILMVSAGGIMAISIHFKGDVVKSNHGWH
ncbi:MAG: DMT family transporter [Ignavibacteria bacterium]|nr:DMT family transporter [Ignavibacteria bacterium]